MDPEARLLLSFIVLSVVVVLIVFAALWNQDQEGECSTDADDGFRTGQVEQGAQQQAHSNATSLPTAAPPAHSRFPGMSTLQSAGKTPLMQWSAIGDETRVQAMLDDGADISAVDDDGDGVLRYAMGTRNGRLFELLLDHGADANARSTSASGLEGFTILHAVAESGWSAGVVALLRHGAKVDARGFGGITALMLAAGGGNDEAATWLLARGADVDAVDDDGDGALMYAASRGHNVTVGRLLALGAHADPAPNASGVTPLVVAAQLAGPGIRRPPMTTADDFTAVVVELLRAGADPTPMYESGYVLRRTVVGSLMEIAPVESVRRLASLGHVTADDGWGVVQLTTSGGARVVNASQAYAPEVPDAMRARLVREYASLDTARAAQRAYDSRSLVGELLSPYGQHGLHAAETAEEVQALLRDGAPIDGVSLVEYGDALQHWETPLLTALVDDRSSVVRELLRSGADVDAPNMAILPNGSGFAHTALHMMLQRREPGRVRELIRAGADVNRQTTLGSTPLYFAASVDDPELVRILLDAGARPQIRDLEGEVPAGAAGPRTRHLFG